MSISPNASRAFFSQRAAELFRARGVLKDEHLLQEHRRASPRTEDEVAFEQGAGGAEFGEGFVRGHAPFLVQIGTGVNGGTR